MKHRFHESAHFQSPNDAWSEAWGSPALRELGRRLVTFGRPVEQAAIVVEQTWLFYSYEVLPLLRVRSPMGIAARKTGNAPSVSLALPAPYPRDSVPTAHSEDLYQHLHEIFVRKFASPLADCAVMTLVPVALNVSPDSGESFPLPRFTDRLKKLFAREGLDYVGVFVDDLVAELETVMEPEMVWPWLDTPSPIFGGRAPRELLNSPDEQQLRDIITRAKFNLPAA